MVYGILRLINFAHGELITFGALVAYGERELDEPEPTTRAGHG